MLARAQTLCQPGDRETLLAVDVALCKLGLQGLQHLALERVSSPGRATAGSGSSQFAVRNCTRLTIAARPAVRMSESVAHVSSSGVVVDCARSYALSFSPQGDFLASASSDGTVRLWNPLDPAVQPIVLSGHDSWVS